MNRKKIYPLYLAVIPAVVFTIFFIVPSTIGYYYAFTNWSAARTTDLKFVGLENILAVIQSSKVPVAFANTLIYAGVKTVMVTLLGFVFAYILNREIRSRTALRTVYFIPSVFSCLVVGLIFSAVFQTRHGTLNNILNVFGVANIQWLGSRGTAVFAICMAEVWRNVGYAIIITLAGMQSVSSDYIEAASGWRSRTVPRVTFWTACPGNATESFGTLMMNEMSAGRYAQSVAVNLVFTVLLVLVSMLYQRFSSRWETVE